MIQEQRLYDALKNSTPVAGRVANRIYPWSAPQGAEEPFLTYMTTFKNEQSCLAGGTSAPERINMQIGCFDTSYLNVKELSVEVKKALQVLNPTIMSEIDMYDYDNKIHEVVINVAFWE